MENHRDNDIVEIDFIKQILGYFWGGTVSGGGRVYDQ